MLAYFLKNININKINLYKDVTHRVLKYEFISL